MFLKRITLCGFKSFPDRVDFDFGPGVTCIVGPNGCGKSNLLDAFKWVLGEQSARSLRGRQMADMIFNGSSARKSSGVAQVDLVFDNTDRFLSFDMDEVTVSRKLYRSGESEYLINHETARLKDVRELFLDTGVGVEAYSVVEQGRVDSLLQTNPVDRRVIFEEAAGISKYKVRRREAERKLERTQQNVLRVEDIINELEKRLRSVKLQAARARTYKEYEVRLNELRSSFAMAEYHRLTVEIESLTQRHNEIGDEVTSARTDISRHEAKEMELASRLDGLNEEINNADSSFIQAKSELLARQERIDAALKRADEQRALLARTTERHESDTRRLEESRRELTQLRETADALTEEERSTAEKIETLVERDHALARDLTQAQATLEDEKAGIIELLRNSAKLHNEIIRLNTHRESLIDRRGRLSQRDAQINAELQEALEQKAQYVRRIRQLDELLADEGRKLDDKKAEAARLAQLQQRLTDERHATRERLSAIQSRREVLEDLERRMEGVGAASRRLLEMKQQPQAPRALQGVVGLVADVFEADVKHAPLIEAALGEHAAALLIEDSAILQKAPKLFADLPGRLKMLCLDRLPPLINERDTFHEKPGFVARAVDLVRFPDRFEHLARRLLARTIVVENLETAIRLADEDVTGYRFLTVHGELVEPDGRIVLGRSSAGDGLISRRSELRDIETQLVTLTERIATLDDQLNRTQAEADHVEAVQQELRTAIYEANTARVEANAAVQNIAGTLDRLSGEQPMIAQEVLLLEQQIHEVLEKAEAESRSLEALEQQNRDRESKVAAHQDRIDRIVASRRQVHEDLTQARVALGQIAEKKKAAADAIAAIERGAAELEKLIAGAAQDIEQCRRRIADAEQTVAAGREQLAEQAQRIEQLQARCEQLRRQREQLRSDSENLSQTVKAARARLESAEARLHEHQMSLAECRVRRDDLVARVVDEMGINLAERYESYQHEDQDWTAVETEIAELRRKMERLGNVNLDAIAELEELQERHRFLASQREDLLVARRQLEQLIERLNEESRQRFSETFEQIRENFRALFRKLFGGGKADILLEDPENLLECGIEIVAQPPGKELQTISLMSGGEKSLTAIALLMSIFKTRPAPFAILDEVDAALDEANNDRFNRIIKEFVSESQFIVITHSKRTMNVADRLYGITMQEPGVSTRVSVQFAGAQVA